MDPHVPYTKIKLLLLMKPQLLNVKTQHRQQNTYPTTAITARPPLTPLTPSCSLILQSEVDNIDSRLAAKEVSDKIRNRTRSAIERVLLRGAGRGAHPSRQRNTPPEQPLLSWPRACLACRTPASRCDSPLSAARLSRLPRACLPLRPPSIAPAGRWRDLQFLSNCLYIKYSVFY